MNKRLNIVEQGLLENHVEIIDVPEHSNGNSMKLVENISTKLGGSISVESAYHIRSKNSIKPGKIVAVLKS